MISRVAVMVLRVCAVIVIVLGILFWTGHAEQLRGLHILAGIVAVLALWAIAFAGMGRPGGVGQLIGALVLGVVLAIIGLTQAQILASSAHWVIEVIHLALGLAVIGMGERLARAAKSQRAGVLAGQR